MMDISINFHFGEKEFARAVEIYENDWCDDLDDINEGFACGACLAVHLEGYEWDALVPFINMLDTETKRVLQLALCLPHKSALSLTCVRTWDSIKNKKREGVSPP